MLPTRGMTTPQGRHRARRTDDRIPRVRHDMQPLRSAVKEEVSALETVVDVQVDAPTGRVTVTSTTPLDEREAIDEAGYELTGRV